MKKIILHEDNYFGLETSLWSEMDSSGWISISTENKHRYIGTREEIEVSEVWLNLRNKKDREVVQGLITHLQLQLSSWDACTLDKSKK